MKKILSFVVLILAVTCLNAQTTHTVYCELLGAGTFGNKLKVSVDFGQKGCYKFSDNTLVDENGKDIKFNSMVDAMNYMSKLGWKFLQTYVFISTTLLDKSKSYEYHWVLSKDVTNDDDVTKGFSTKVQYEQEHKK